MTDASTTGRTAVANFVARNWHEVKVGDVIFCPVDGQEEFVKESRPYLDDLWFIKTRRHDHSPYKIQAVRVKC